MSYVIGKSELIRYVKLYCTGGSNKVYEFAIYSPLSSDVYDVVVYWGKRGCNLRSILRGTFFTRGAHSFVDDKIIEYVNCKGYRVVSDVSGNEIPRKYSKEVSTELEETPEYGLDIDLYFKSYCNGKISPVEYPVTNFFMHDEKNGGGIVWWSSAVMSDANAKCLCNRMDKMLAEGRALLNTMTGTFYDVMVYFDDTCNDGSYEKKVRFAKVYGKSYATYPFKCTILNTFQTEGKFEAKREIKMMSRLEAMRAARPRKRRSLDI